MLSILYQDRALLVCLKPPGLLSQDGPGGSLPERLRRQAGGEIYPVHRLDREAGGVMVYARTRAAAASLSAAIQAGELEKEYLCVLHGRPQEPEGTYRDLLLHDRGRNKRGAVWSVSASTRGAPTRSGSSLPAGARPCWGTGNTAAAPALWLCGAPCWPFPTRRAGRGCASPACRRGRRGRASGPRWRADKMRSLRRAGHKEAGKGEL